MNWRTSFSALMDRAHLKVVRTLGYVLTLGTEEAWRGLVPVLRARLTVDERAALACSALKALNREDAVMIAGSALCRGAGAPLPPLFDPLDEATRWVGMADTEELDAYAVAIFNAMSSHKQRAFLNFAGRGAA